MKKILMLGLVLAVMVGFCSVPQTYAKDESAPKSDNIVIKEAIKKYKAKNYVGCISDLRLYTEKNPHSAVSWYYLGNAYMYIGMQQEALEAFNHVVELNTSPSLTSYAIQAELCMQSPDNCQYKKFTADEVKELKADPAAFLKAYAEKQMQAPEKSQETMEIETLINGGYPQGMYPAAAQFIRDEQLRIQQVQH